LCVCVCSDDREHGFPTRLFSWCPVQRTRSVGTRCLVTANDSRDNSISYNRSLDRPVAGERRDAGSKTAQDSFRLNSVDR